jgi:hypothetical protein
MYAHVWWRVLTYADVCWRMLTYTGVCRHSSAHVLAMAVQRLYPKAQVRIYYYICVLILLYMCPHTAIYVSSYRYICPHAALNVSSFCYMCSFCYYTCPHTTTDVFILLYVSPAYTSVYAGDDRPSYFNISHTTIYMSWYCYICVLILFGNRPAHA